MARLKFYLIIVPFGAALAFFVAQKAETSNVLALVVGIFFALVALIPIVALLTLPKTRPDVTYRNTYNTIIYTSPHIAGHRELSGRERYGVDVDTQGIAVGDLAGRTHASNLLDSGSSHASDTSISVPWTEITGAS
jgi:hypothetical protein